MSFAPKIIGKAQKLAKIGPDEIWSSERISDLDAKNWNFGGQKVIFAHGAQMTKFHQNLSLRVFELFQ